MKMVHLGASLGIVKISHIKDAQMGCSRWFSLVKDFCGVNNCELFIVEAIKMQRNYGLVAIKEALKRIFNCTVFHFKEANICEITNKYQKFSNGDFVLRCAMHLNGIGGRYEEGGGIELLSIFK